MGPGGPHGLQLRWRAPFGVRGGFDSLALPPYIYFFRNQFDRGFLVLYKTLGTTDINISEFALGCWPFAGGKVWGVQDDSMSIQTVHAALDKGINFFDTAEGYNDDSHSEEVLGQALINRRADSVIATKISTSHLLPDLIEKTCENSLRRLRSD